MIGYAIELFYKNPLLTVGPPTEDGFFYDFWAQEVVSKGHFKELEQLVAKIVKAKH